MCGSGCTSRGTEHFPEHDPAAVDAARFFFPSPGDAEYRADFTHTDLAVDMDSMPESDETALSRPENTLITRVSGAWDNNLIVTLSDGRKVRAVKLSSETPILCPFHNDITASAFVNFSEHSGNHFIY